MHVVLLRKYMVCNWYPGGKDRTNTQLARALVGTTRISTDKGEIPYSLNQTPLSISRRSRIEAAPPDTLKEIVAALE